ncbi:hypothetical protein K0A97_02630 [Patescibacteria group bacterium]|nr:hypothetical protein [Patescibacteria group bacterium]
MADTVKIDSKILERVENLLKKGEKKIKYANKKHFINLAVLELLKKEEKKK